VEDYNASLAKALLGKRGLNLFQVQRNLYVCVLYLDKNNIKYLRTSLEFRGFLHVLSLGENGLKVIGPSCFRNLEGIQTIFLGKNDLASLPQNLLQGLPSLRNRDYPWI